MSRFSAPKMLSSAWGEVCLSQAARAGAWFVSAHRTKQLPCPRGRHGCFLPISLSLLIAEEPHTQVNTNQEKNSTMVTVPEAPQLPDTLRSPQDISGRPLLQIRHLHQGSKHMMNF